MVAVDAACVAAPKAKSEPKPKLDARPDAKPEAKLEPKPKADLKLEIKPDAKAEPKPKAETKLEIKPEAKVEAKPKVESKSEVKSDVKAESKPKVEVKSEGKADPKAKPEVKLDSKIKSTPSANDDGVLAPALKAKIVSSRSETTPKATGSARSPTASSREAREPTKDAQPRRLSAPTPSQQPAPKRKSEPREQTVGGLKVAPVRMTAMAWGTVPAFEANSSTPLGARESSDERAMQEDRSGGDGSGGEAGFDAQDASAETDSFDEEIELLRCQADLIEAAAEIGITTTSAEEDMLTTDLDEDDDEGMAFSMSRREGSHRMLRAGVGRLSVGSVVIEEDEEDDLYDDERDGPEAANSQMRSRLWAQSLLRLKRSIDEIYSLCEFENEDTLCQQVHQILNTASGDFCSLMKRFETQQEYAWLAGDYPWKSGVAWSTRMPTPKVPKGGERASDVMERTLLSSPTNSAQGRMRSASRKRSEKISKSGDATDERRRSNSLDSRAFRRYDLMGAPPGLTRGPSPGSGTSPPPGSGISPPPGLGPSSPPGSRADSIDVEFSRLAGGGTGEAYGALERDACSRESERGSLEAQPMERLHLMVQSALDSVHSRGCHPLRASPEELLKKSEERQRRAQQIRLSYEDQRLSQLKQVGDRTIAARERRQQREQQKQHELMEKMTRARRTYQDQLRMVCQRAKKENRKASEVVYLSKEALKREKAVHKQKQEHAHVSRALMREQMRKRLIESANRVAKVSENRRKLQEDWQQKLSQDLEDRDRLASQRRQEHIESIRLKSLEQERRSELVLGKRRELLEEDERSSQDFLRLKSKLIGRLALNVDGLPDGAREEVAEQLQGATPGSAASRSEKMRASPGGSAAARARHRSSLQECGTPPRVGRSSSPHAESSSSPLRPTAGSSDPPAENAEQPAVGADTTKKSSKLALKPRLEPPPTGASPGAGAADTRGDVRAKGGASSSATAVAASKAKRKPRSVPVPQRQDVVDCAAEMCASAASDDTGDEPMSDGETDDEEAEQGTGKVARKAPGTPRENRRKPKSESKPTKDRGSGRTDPPAVPADTEQREVSPPVSSCTPCLIVPVQPRNLSPSSVTRSARSTSPCSPLTGDLNQAQAAAGCLEALREQLRVAALSDEEALRLSCEFEGKKTSAVNTAHRARLSKLAADLKRAVGSASTPQAGGAKSSTASEESTVDIERAEVVLTDFCRVLGQSQREADFALVLQIGCAGTVIDLCSKVRLLLWPLPGGGGSAPSAVAQKQLSSVMLSSLKWLGLVSKQSVARVFLLLTNRIVCLADVAISCLKATAEASGEKRDTWQSPDSNASVLFLPQVLHVLSLHVKQALPEVSMGIRHTLVSHLMVCGLSEKLTDTLHGAVASVQRQKLFDTASPVPLLLLRAMCFLATLVGTYRRPGQLGGGGEGPSPGGGGLMSSSLVEHDSTRRSGADPTTTPTELADALVLQTLKRTELFGTASVLVSILLSERQLQKPKEGEKAVPFLPQTVLSLSVQAVRILNHVASLHLPTLQESLGACHQQELYHLLVCLLDYCTARMQDAKPGQSQDESRETELLHETITLLGNYCLLRTENQGVVCFGEGQTLLAKITSLPLFYFMDERGRLALFPTILATCFRSQRNLELLRHEMNLTMLRKFLSTHIAAMKDEGGQSKSPRPPAAEPAGQGFRERFPAALWQEALEFFTDEG